MKKKRKSIESFLWLLTLLSVGAAALAGLNQDSRHMADHLEKLWPEARRFEKKGFNTFEVFAQGQDQPSGYVIGRSANGFGGPLSVAVAVDTQGCVADARVIDHKETPSWYAKVMKSPLLSSLKKKPYTDPFEIGLDVDGISGATLTSRAVIASVKAGAVEIAVKELGLAEPAQKPRPFLIGVPEVVLGLLLIMGVWSIKYASGKTRKRLRWLMMITGMGILGFWANHPLTLVDMNKFLMGYWPDLHDQLYWYLLVFGLLLIFLTTGKNIYCHAICPFGAAQETIGVFGKARRNESRFYPFFKWLRRVVVWMALCTALVFRNPGISSYEVYATLFSLSGTNRQVLFLSMVLLFALFVTRPWCRYLCPVPAFEAYFRFTMDRIKNLLIFIGLKGRIQP